jgi:hypothetical protein
MEQLGRSLLADAGSVLVTSMSTVVWPQGRPRFARLLGRGDRKHEQLVAGQLDAARARLRRAAGRPLPDDLADAISEVISLLRAHLSRPTPVAEAEIRALVADLGMVMSARPCARLG